MLVTIRVGFLGAGFISGVHTWMLHKAAVEHEIRAVHDPDHSRAAAFAERHGAEAMGEDELLDSVDAVYVASWTSEHHRLVTAAADRGVAVFCEKPLAMNAVEARAMTDVVERSGIVNQVGLVLRFLPQFIFARSLLADRRAGRTMAVSFRDDQFIPNQGLYESDWRVDASRCGRGALLEHSIHDVDILAWLCGPVERVGGVVREMHGYDRIDDVAAARLEFSDGAVASLTSVWHDLLERPSMRHIEVFCEELFVEMDGTERGPIRWQFAGEDLHELQGAELAAACCEAGLAAPDDLISTDSMAMFNPANQFLAAVSDASPSPVPFREALVAHDLVDAIYESAALGGTSVTP